ncbi:serine/threonine-protein kinase [Georgenia muralis]
MRPEAGLVLGARYELTTRIAVGGMGEVWEATDRRLGRTVAAKVMRAELAGDELFLSRLRAEARNTAGLRHENLAMLLDHGEQEGSGYLVMELVRGETLADLLERERRIAPAGLVPILVQACRGLHAAHTAGVVHRDVKPANVLIATGGQVKLTDFGISLAANQAPMTSAGMVMGTAQYLPPEQAMGKAATAAGDVYALGVLAYECLAGHRPFTGETQVDIAFAHVNTPLPPLPGTVPAPLRAVVEQMLAKDPAARPASALACARALETVAAELDAAPTRRARREPVVDRVRRSLLAPPTGAMPLADRGARAPEDPLPRRREIHRASDRSPLTPGGRTAGAPGEPSDSRRGGGERPLPPGSTAFAGPPSSTSVAGPPAPPPAVRTAAAAPPGASRTATLTPPSAARRATWLDAPAPHPDDLVMVGTLRSATTPAAAHDPARTRAGAEDGGDRAATRRALRRAAQRSWTVPTWTEVAADRIWLRAMAVVLAILVALALLALGTLGRGGSSAAGPPATESTMQIRTTEKDD